MEDDMAAGQGGDAVIDMGQGGVMATVTHVSGASCIGGRYGHRHACKWGAMYRGAGVNIQHGKPFSTLMGFQHHCIVCSPL